MEIVYRKLSLRGFSRSSGKTSVRLIPLSSPRVFQLRFQKGCDKAPAGNYVLPNVTTCTSTERFRSQRSGHPTLIKSCIWSLTRSLHAYKIEQVPKWYQKSPSPLTRHENTNCIFDLCFFPRFFGPLSVIFKEWVYTIYFNFRILEIVYYKICCCHGVYAQKCRSHFSIQMLVFKNVWYSIINIHGKAYAGMRTPVCLYVRAIIT